MQWVVGNQGVGMGKMQWGRIIEGNGGGGGGDLVTHGEDELHIVFVSR